jgi:hypothetical protein
MAGQELSCIKLDLPGDIYMVHPVAPNRIDEPDLVNYQGKTFTLS